MTDLSDIYPENILAAESRAASAQMNIGMFIGIDLLIGSDYLGTVDNPNSGSSKASKAFAALSPVLKEGRSKFNDKNPTTKVKNIILHSRRINGKDGDYLEPCLIATFQNAVDWTERKKLCFEGPDCLVKMLARIIEDRSKEAVNLIVKHNPIDSPLDPCCIHYSAGKDPTGRSLYEVGDKLELLSLYSLCVKQKSLEDLHLLIDNQELAFGSVAKGLGEKNVPSKPRKKLTSLCISFCFKDKSGWMVKGYDMQDQSKVRKLITMSLDDALVSSDEMKRLLQTKKLTSMAQLAHYVIEIVYCPVYKSIHTQDTKKVTLSIIELTSIRKARVDEIKRYMGSS